MNLPVGSAQHEPAVNGCRGVVGVVFHVSREFEHRPIVDIVSHRPPSRRSSGHDRRRGRSEAAPDRDLVIYDQGQRTTLAHRPTSRLEDAVEMARGVFRSDVANAPEIVRGRLDVAAKLQGQREHVETRTEIRR